MLFVHSFFPSPEVWYQPVINALLSKDGRVLFYVKRHWPTGVLFHDTKVYFDYLFHSSCERYKIDKNDELLQPIRSTGTMYCRCGSHTLQSYSQIRASMETERQQQPWLFPVPPTSFSAAGYRDRTRSARRILKKVSRVESCLGRRRLVFACSPKPGQWPL